MKATPSSQGTTEQALRRRAERLAMIAVFMIAIGAIVMCFSPWGGVLFGPGWLLGGFAYWTYWGNSNRPWRIGGWSGYTPPEPEHKSAPVRRASDWNPKPKPAPPTPPKAD